MGKKLIITEKPSVSRDIVDALGGFVEKDKGEYWESDEYVCTYAVGHLLGLIEPEDIDPSYKRWTLNNLPIVPETFKLKPKSNQNKRLACIKKLARRKDVDALINACDAAREGELIFREIVDFYENEKPTQRLWLQSMTKDAIRSGFKNLKPGKEVIGLGDAAECRSRADWLIGMNATRALSVRLRTRAQKGAWSAGRVQTPTLALLVARELKILNFISDPYWRITANFQVGSQKYEGYWYDPKFKRDEEKPYLKNDRIFDKDKADRIVDKISSQSGLVSENRRARKSKAPALFNLTALQKAMSSRFGWSAKRTLQAAQRCYESHKVLTYPRTSSSCLPEDYRPEVDKIINKFAKSETYGRASKFLLEKGRENEDRVFNDAGVTDHFAIIPTGQLPAGLKTDDLKLFDTVVRRFLATFYPPAIYDKVDRVTIVKGEHFKTGPMETLVEAGWLYVYDKLLEDKKNSVSLPPLKEGEKESKDIPMTHVKSEISEDKTKPPARIGEAGLLSLMEFAGRHVEDEELAEALTSAEGLGTAATRADIIENLKIKQYVDQSLRPTPKGIRLIETLHRMGASRLTSAELTAELEIHLNEVEKQERTADSFIKEIVDYVTEIIEKVKGFDYDVMYPNENSLGTCPICKNKQIYEKAWFYACESSIGEGKEHGCGLLLWKDTYGRYLSKGMAKTLISEGTTGEIDGFRNTSGQSYKGIMNLEGSKVTVVPTGAPAEQSDMKFDIDPKPLALSPLDEGKDVMVIETPTHFISQARKKAMDEGETRPQGFILPRLVCKREITREEAIEYIKNGETAIFGDFISKKGRKFRAKLKIKPDGRHEFDFPPREPRKKAIADGEASEAASPAVKKKTAAKKKVTKKKTAAKKKVTKKKTAAKKNSTIDPETAPF